MAKGGLTVLRETRGHVEVEWEIRNFLHQPYECGEFFERPNFLLGDATWCLRIFTNGISKEESRVWLSLCLTRSRDSCTHTVSINFRLQVGGSEIADRKREATFNRNDFSWGTKKFIEKSKLSTLLKDASSDGVLVAMCAVRLLDGRQKEAATQASLPVGLITLSKNFEQLFIGGNESDVEVKAKERKFEAHKLILSSRSPVLKSMIEHKMAESNSGVIEILDLDPDHVKDFLLYLYTGDFHHVTSTNVFDLYTAAVIYALDELRAECRIRMVGDISVDSVLEVIHLATVHNEADMLKSGTEFFIENAEAILMTEKWDLLHNQNAPLAKELLIKMIKGFKENKKNTF